MFLKQTKMRSNIMSFIIIYKTRLRQSIYNMYTEYKNLTDC